MIYAHPTPNSLEGRIEINFSYFYAWEIQPGFSVPSCRKFEYTWQDRKKSS
jgi:hypothetical protein